mgnify:FL=1
MATSNRAPKPRSGTLRSNERAAIYQRRQEEHALGSFNVQMDAACDASAMADSLQKSLAELSIDSPLRNHANFATISAKAWEGSPGSQASLNPPIPDTALATMFFDAQGPRPTYANFATSVPEQNPFTRAAAQDAENCSASTHGRGTSQSNISQYNSGCRGSQINYHYHAAAPPAAAPPAATVPAASAPTAAPPSAAPPAASAPAAAPPAAAAAAAAPPSSVAQQLADVKAMFEQGLIPSREIYEAKVLQILGLP